MDFEARARRAYRRGEVIRAVVLLVEGLKRSPERQDAVDLLTDIFANDIRSAGLEADFVDVMSAQHDGEERVRFTLEGFARRQLDGCGRELARTASRVWGPMSWPPRPADRIDHEPRDTAGEAVLLDAEQDSSEGDDEPADDVEEVGGWAGERGRAGPSAWNDATPTPGGDQEQYEGNKASSEDGQESEARADQRSGQRRSAREGRRRVLGWLALIILLACAIYLAREAMAPPQEAVKVAVARVDVAQIDTAAPPAEVESTNAANQGEPQRDKLAFKRAVSLVDWGREVDVKTTAKSRWGLAARATAAADADQFEEAIADVTRLEQVNPDTLAAVWARGYLEEARGRDVEAEAAYAQGARDFEGFVPFITGQLRLMTRQGRLSEASALFEALGRLSPSHPYRELEGVAESGDILSPAEGDGDLPLRGEAFAGNARPELVEGMALVWQAATARSLPEAREKITRAVELAPGLASANVVAGIIAAQGGHVGEAERRFADALASPGLSEEVSRRFENVAQRSLLALGRADRAVRFGPPFRWGEDDQDEAAARDLPAAQGRPLPLEPAEATPLDVESEGWRALALVELGFFDTAERLLDDGWPGANLDGFSGFLMVHAEILRGRRWRAVDASRRIRHEGYKALSRAAIALHDGDYDHAARAAEAAQRSGGATPFARQYRALALAARGDLRQALESLETDDAVGVDVLEAEIIKMRVLARRDPSSSAVKRSYAMLLGAEPQGVSKLLDLAATDFWRRRFESAEGHLAAASRVAARHPEVHWWTGLVTMGRGARGDAEAALRRSWRTKTGDSKLLNELGQIQAGLGRHDMARELHYSALLADRFSTAAISGMGAAYLASDRARGRRDLALIVRNYGSGNRELAPKAEVLRWLAVLYGVREGTDEGIEWLQEAESLVGLTPDLLVERARYRGASGDPTEARRDFARALERDSAHLDAHLGIARVALALGDEVAAKTHLERALDLRVGGERRAWVRGELDRLAGME